MEEKDQHRAKRRKTKGNDPNVVKIGDKTISLAAFLAPSPPKKREEERPAPAKEQNASTEKNSKKRNDDDPTKKGPHQRDASIRQQKQNKKPEKQDSPLLKARKALPIWAYRDEIKSSLRGKGDDTLLIVGETGSGKSTQTPQFLYDEPWCRRQTVRLESGAEVAVGGMIAITQPRRVAATTLAGRVAREMGTPLEPSSAHKPGSVGYSVRFDHRVPKGAKIKFLTEGMLLQELLRDPDLRQYSAVIVDEIHERSIDVDLIAGFLKQILTGDKAGRGGVPLKVVIMSATTDVEKIQGFFDTSNNNNSTGGDDLSSPSPSTPSPTMRLLRIKGRQYPVEIKHTDKPVPDIKEAAVKRILDIHLHESLPGDILTFLTGQEQIQDVQRLLEDSSADLASNAPRLAVFPLYGQLSMQAQQDAFQPAKTKFTRKVILATNIAETSVTVPGVRYVVDCGKAKVKQYRPSLGMESLLAKVISKSSAIQRTGRAGREAPGKCYRLYTSSTYDGLEDADLPEMLRNDVLGAVLTMKARGINDVLSFPLMDPPDPGAVENALVHLRLLGALSRDGSITDVGRKLAVFPVSAPYGRVLLAAATPEFDCLVEAIDVVSVLTAGETIFYRLGEQADDEHSSSRQDTHHGQQNHHHQQHHKKRDNPKADEDDENHNTNEEEEEERSRIEEARNELVRREGDILTLLTTMQRYASENADRVAWCHARRISVRNMRQALNIRKQLRGLCVKEKLLPPSSSSYSSTSTSTPSYSQQEGFPPDPQPFTPLSPARAELLLKCFLRGFATRTAVLAPDSSYVTVHERQVVSVHPSSGLHGFERGRAEAIMFLEHVFTQKNYVKKVSAVRGDWIVEALALAGGSA